MLDPLKVRVVIHKLTSINIEREEFLCFNVGESSK